MCLLPDQTYSHVIAVCLISSAMCGYSVKAAMELVGGTV